MTNCVHVETSESELDFMKSLRPGDVYVSDELYNPFVSLVISVTVHGDRVRSMESIFFVNDLMQSVIEQYVYFIDARVFIRRLRLLSRAEQGTGI